MLRDFSVQSLFMGVLTAFVGFASSFAVVLHGLTGVGASEVQAVSGLMALSISLGACAIVISLATRLPVSIAWSTPGAALLASSGAVEGGFSAAVGAFLLCGLLIVVAGLWKPLGRVVSSIPAALANAMLAGLALIGAFSSSAMAAFTEPDTREAAAITFLVTASGVSFAGVSGAFWGLIAGGLMLALARFARRKG